MSKPSRASSHPPRKSLRRYLANVTTPEGGEGRKEKNQLPFPHCPPPPLSPPIPLNSALSLPLQAPPPPLPRSLLLLLFFSSPPSPLSFPTLKRGKKKWNKVDYFFCPFLPSIIFSFWSVQPDSSFCCSPLCPEGGKGRHITTSQQHPWHLAPKLQKIQCIYLPGQKRTENSFIFLFDPSSVYILQFLECIFLHKVN